MPGAVNPNGPRGPGRGGTYDVPVPRDRSPYTLRAAVRRQAVLAIALPVLVLIVAIGAAGHAPLAGALLATELAVLAVLRATLPTSVVGALAVRPRAVDVTVLALLAVGIAALAGSPNL